jgi:hypothetical protein
MLKYDFELTDFALSDIGIHLLRNRYNYKTVAYHDLDKVQIKRGTESKNSLLSLFIGIALLSISVFKCISLYQDFNNPTVYTIYIESILLPLFPALVGFYLVYVCIKRGLILQVEQGSIRYKLRLKEIEKAGQTENLKLYLSKKLCSKLIIEDNL